MLLFEVTAAASSEYIQLEAPTPASAAKIDGPIDHAFSAKPASDRYLWDTLKTALDETAPFWRDSRMGFDLRSFNFDRRNAVLKDSEAWALGGQLWYESGWWNNVSVKAAWYNSTELDSKGSPSGLLTPLGDDINVLGEANIRYRISDTFLDGSVVTLYRQTLDLPYVNKHDSRMLRATHEGYTIQRADSAFDYVLGHLTKFKDVFSDEFLPMSVRAGALGSDEGLTMAGARFSVNEQLTIGAIDYYGWDTFNTLFAEASYHSVMRGNLDFRLSAQLTHQHSVGDELVGDFDTGHVAAQAAFGWRGAVLKFAGSKTSDNQRIRSPWGGKPTYLSIQRLDFDRPNEEAFLLGLSYNPDFFSSLGLSSYANIGYGRNAVSALTGEPLPDRIEYDLTVDYKPATGLLEGLWLRLRYAHVDVDGDGATVRDIRVILNYEIPLL